MIRRLPVIALLFVLAGLCIPQTATTYVTPEIRRVGDKLACNCGSCNNTVATCQMLQCHYSSPAREKIATMQKQGANDQAIVDSFVKETGLIAMAAPPTNGFSLLGWTMPFIALLLGLGAIVIYQKRFRKPTPTPETTLPRDIDEKYRQRIEREVAELE
ncbi:MAG: cytochrome c-type biogenesis protein CcmH [Bryobacteraceae bacterium]|nr:cytochrome c-type biogenesis protein CcmH [Bryobacteraceae bacterium]